VGGWGRVWGGHQARWARSAPERRPRPRPRPSPAGRSGRPPGAEATVVVRREWPPARERRRGRDRGGSGARGRPGVAAAARSGPRPLLTHPQAVERALAGPRGTQCARQSGLDSPQPPQTHRPPSYLPCVRPPARLPAVLRRHCVPTVHRVQHHGQVDVLRGDDDLGGARVRQRRDRAVELGHQLLHGRLGAVALPVAAHEEAARGRAGRDAGAARGSGRGGGQGRARRGPTRDGRRHGGVAGGGRGSEE